MSFGSRLKERRESLGITQPQLADMLQVSKGAIGNYETDSNSPKATILYKMFDVLKCDANFLFQDEMNDCVYRNISTPEEFEKIIKKYRHLDALGQSHVDTILQWETERMEQLAKSAEAPAAKPPVRLIQYYQRLASAGTGQYVFDNIPTDQIEIPDIPEYKKVRYALGVNGISMEPTYSHGDILLVEPTPEVNLGEIGIFIHKGESYVKEFGDGVLHSLNDLYDDIEITEDTKCIGRVVDKLNAPINISKGLIQELRALTENPSQKHA